VERVLELAETTARQNAIRRMASMVESARTICIDSLSLVSTKVPSYIHPLRFGVWICMVKIAIIVAQSCEGPFLSNNYGSHNESGE
jgi:hypothetical protein